MSLLTKVVVFGDSASESAAGVQIFGDAIANINADGTDKTEFYPGESYYLLIIIPDDYRLLSVKATDGTLTATGQVSRTQIDRILFTDKGEAMSLSQLPAGEVTPEWYGKSAVLTVTGQQVSVAAAPCIADIGYSYTAMQYRLTAPASLNIGPEDGADWPIGVVVYVEARAK